MTMLATGNGDPEHIDQGAYGEDQRIRGIHDGRTEQHADCVQVIRCSRHDVARASALIVGERELLKMMEQIVAQVELDIAGDADDDPTSKELKNALAQGDHNHQKGIESELLRRPAALLEVVERELDYLRRLDGDAIQ
jgi:hypothetical protein